MTVARQASVGRWRHQGRRPAEQCSTPRWRIGGQVRFAHANAHISQSFADGQPKITPLGVAPQRARHGGSSNDPLAVRSSREVSGACHACGWRPDLAAQSRQHPGGHTHHARRLPGPAVGRRPPVRRRTGHRSPPAPEPGRYHLCRTAFLRWARPDTAGVPADELRDRTANLEELWPGRQVRVLTEQVEVHPAAALEAWVVNRAARCDQDPLGPRVLAMAKAGTPIAVMAERLCISPRQLHRRCLPAFGYGPRRLARVLRFQRALEEIRCGVSLAHAAAASGYADQAHLSREVRALAGTTPRGLLGEPYADGSGANRSTGRPSGSWTTA